MIHFELVSPRGLKFKGDVYEVLIPTQAGTIAVFEDHMPLLSAGIGGVIGVRKKAEDPDREMEHFAVNGGVLEVDGKNLSFLSDEVTTSGEISEQEAEAALARAQELMAGASTQLAIHEAKRLLHHSSAKLHLSRLKKRHHQ
jgi:F-type H+-transporting ATPase subunit epsilon